MKETITFQTFRRFQLEERKEVLQKLPPNFWDACREWLERKQARYEASRDLTLLHEIESFKRVVEEIFDRRERKLLHLALHAVRGKVTPTNLLPEEKGLFDESVDLLRKLRQDLLGSLLAGKKKPKESRKAGEKLVLVKILEAIPRFVGTDLHTYGPLKPGDLVTLPPNVARFLIQKGKAEATQVKP